MSTNTTTLCIFVVVVDDFVAVVVVVIGALYFILPNQHDPQACVPYSTLLTFDFHFAECGFFCFPMHFQCLIYILMFTMLVDFIRTVFFSLFLSLLSLAYSMLCIWVCGFLLFFLRLHFCFVVCLFFFFHVCVHSLLVVYFHSSFVPSFSHCECESRLRGKKSHCEWNLCV